MPLAGPKEQEVYKHRLLLSPLRSCPMRLRGPHLGILFSQLGFCIDNWFSYSLRLFITSLYSYPSFCLSHRSWAPSLPSGSWWRMSCLSLAGSVSRLYPNVVFLGVIAWLVVQIMAYLKGEVPTKDWYILASHHKQGKNLLRKQVSRERNFSPVTISIFTQVIDSFAALFPYLLDVIPCLLFCTKPGFQCP